MDQKKKPLQLNYFNTAATVLIELDENQLNFKTPIFQLISSTDLRPTNLNDSKNFFNSDRKLLSKKLYLKSIHELITDPSFMAEN
jgi:hypothetical protein